jgi:trigger factor
MTQSQAPQNIMDVSVESPGPILRRMTITVPAEELDQRIETRISRLAKTAKLPGFRPGKIPRKVVESRFSSQVLQEAIEELIDSSYRDALQKESILPVGLPSIEAKKMNRGEDLEYVATFEVFPTIGRLNIKGHKIEKPVCSVEKDDIDRTIETLRRQHTEWEIEEAPAQSGDRLLINYLGTIEGEPFKGGESSDHSVILGQNSLLPEFETELNGQLPGAELSITTKIPANYPMEAIGGKEAVFIVQVKEVAKPRLPDVNDAFIQKFGLPEGTQDAFRLQIRENLEREADVRVKAQLRGAVFNALLDGNEFDLPKVLVEEEINNAVATFRRQLEQQGLPSDEPVDREPYREEAERRVRLGLVMREAVRERGIKADDSAVRPRIEKFAQSYDDPKQVLDWYYADAARLGQFEGVVVEELLVEQLLEEAEVVEKQVTLKEFMKPVSPDAVDAEREQDREAP